MIRIAITPAAYEAIRSTLPRARRCGRCSVCRSIHLPRLSLPIGFAQLAFENLARPRQRQHVVLDLHASWANL